MVFVDASVLVAILLGEADGEWQMARLTERHDEIRISSVVRYEVVTSLAVAFVRREGRSRIGSTELSTASSLLDRLLAQIGGTEIPITPEIGRLAMVASARFGKLAAHPARLNMGDCFAHACATSLGAPLLYKGEDFALTDLA